ncbi:hypothetical protein D3C75_838280 [compost metagenome]
MRQRSQLAGRLRTIREADAQRHWHLKIGGHFAHLIEDYKPALLQCLQAAVIEQHQVTFGRQPPQVHLELFAPLGDLTGHLGDQ